MYVKPMTTDEGTDLTQTLMIILTCIQRSFSPKFLVYISFHTNQRLWKLLLIETGTTLQNLRKKTIFKLMAFRYCVVRNREEVFD